MGQGGMGQGMGQGGMGMGQGMGMGMGQKSKATKPADAGVVWVLKSGEIRPVEVKIGLSNGVSTAVEGNLNPADSVVTGVSSTFVARTGTSTQSPFVQQRRR